jgi:hypothetical protein
MSESELSRALLACEAPLGNDTRQLIGRVLERDRWRVRLLTTLTLFLWLLTAVGVFVWGYLWFSAMQPRLLAKAENRAHIDDSSAWVTIGSAAAKTLMAVTTTTLLAASSTIWLVFATRRATLRQVNAQLAEISEQLRQIQQTLAKPSTAAPGGS